MNLSIGPNQPIKTWKIETDADLEAFSSAMSQDSAAASSVEVSFHSRGIGSKLGNRLTHLVAKLLEENKPLSRVELHCHVWNDKDNKPEDALAKGLKVNKTVKHLDLRWNYLPNKCIFGIAEALAQNHTVEFLDLSGNGIDAEGLSGVAHIIKYNRSITTLKLDGNNDLFHIPNRWNNKESKKQFAEAFKTNTVLKEISMRECFLRKDGAIEFANALQINPALQLRRLNLSQNYVEDEGAKALAAALKAHDNLEDVNLSGNSIGDDGIGALADALKGKRSLKVLDLSNNSFSDTGAKKIAELVKSLPHLHTLKLGENQIGKEGAKALAAAMKTHQCLKSLDLYRTCLGDEGVEFIADALKENTSLVELRLGWVGIKDSIKALADALRVNKNLSKLDNCCNNIDFTGDIASALMVNTTLMDLDMSMNNIETLGACVLAAVLKDRPMNSIDLSHNRIGEKGITALEEAFANKKGKFQWYGNKPR